MLGFELNINNEKVSAAHENGAVTILLSKISTELMDEIEINFIGSETNKDGIYKSFNYYKSPMALSDEVTIKVKDISENSEPKEVTVRERGARNEEKLKSYFALRKELEEKGLI